MASGFKDMVINPQERVASADFNRMQRFHERDFAEVLRYMLDGTSELDVGGGANFAEYSTLGTPLRAEVISGLLVRPAVGSFAVSVDPGVLFAVAPDAAPDESNYKHVRDAGSSGSLTIGANASGSTRIDVIECRINPTPAVVTDTRDVFDTVSGTFSATLLTKERSSRLEYRVRAGTAGAGIPANQSGWLPLCVASVPDGAADNDDVTFWDVRPLVSDRAYGSYALTTTLPKILEHEVKVERVGATDVRASGKVWAIHGGRRVGGLLKRGTPGADADYLNVADADNQDTGTIAEVLSNTPIVYLAFPAGLPRWSRYNDAPAPREPRTPIGIPVVSYTRPVHGTGAPASALALPASTGLGGTTSNAVAVLALMRNGVSQFASGFGTNGVLHFGDGSEGASMGAYSAGTIVATVTDTSWPQNAKAVWCEVKATVTVGANANVPIDTAHVLVRLDNTASAVFATVLLPGSVLVNQTGGSLSKVYKSGLVRLPLPVHYPSGAAATPRRLDVVLPTGLTVTSSSLFIYGYEF